jgi:MarR family transcriptional regulator, organic hydroperoxide resistance regulator
MNKKQYQSAGQTGRYDAPWDMPRYRNWISVAKANHIVKRALADGLSDAGLDFPQYEILAAMIRFPGMMQQELADRLLVGRSNLSMLLPEMERRGLVERRPDPHDKRLRRLFLTPLGEEHATRGLAVHVALIEHMMEALSAEECDAIGEMMHRVIQHMKDKPFGR